ncbi:MAG: MoxR family ATPase [Flavobacteriia bacterium]|nr:MoxR family ATPase [Flavobacteriia bacterium]
MPKDNVTPEATPLSDIPNPMLASEPHFQQRDQSELIWVAQKVNRVREEMRKYVIGQSEMIELMLAGIFANGHLLLEGVPGVAKTLSAKALSKVLDVEFSRIQFTPDLMPSDVIGTSVFNMKDTTFNFKKGPIFSNIVLIDEINRAPAKTQAALFEVMEERQITYDGNQYKMSFPFLVIATQNPVEQEGTYNLPEAQLDRFLFKIKLDYPTLEEETSILLRYKDDIKTPSLDQITPIFNATELQKVQSIIEKIIIEERLISYIAQIINKTRNHGKIYLGGSPRASLSIMKSAKAFAAIRGRDFVTPDDIQFVAIHVLNHRMILTPEAEMEGSPIEDIIREIVQSIEVPR